MCGWPPRKWLIGCQARTEGYRRSLTLNLTQCVCRRKTTGTERILLDDLGQWRVRLHHSLKKEFRVNVGKTGRHLEAWGSGDPLKVLRAAAEQSTEHRALGTCCNVHWSFEDLVVDDCVINYLSSALKFSRGHVLDPTLSGQSHNNLACHVISYSTSLSVLPLFFHFILLISFP